MQGLTPNVLSAPLPAEFAQGEFGSRWFYDRYATFSWPWVWRRTLLFGVFVVPYGALLGVIHGLFAHSLADGLAVGGRAALAMLLLVGLAPTLAALVRHRHCPPHFERLAVVTAIALGIALAGLARAHATDYHDHLMGLHFTGLQRLLQMFTGTVPMHSVLERSTDFATALLVQAVGGGALALRSYLGEAQRWQDYAARRELSALRQQKLVAEARLSVLQAQVAPHFLFNTLASVAAQIASEPQRAAQLANALAEYLRATLPRLSSDGPVAASTVGEQFEICRSYLDVMALRLSGRLTTAVHLPAELAGLGFPPLLLISLVENAVTHGIEPKRGNGRIELRALRSDDSGRPVLEVLVRDDGPGLKQGLLEGTGISNVRLQLATLFGPAAQLSVESPVDGGVRAAIRIPLELLPT